VEHRVEGLARRLHRGNSGSLKRLLQ
jgi:hypothetical protein